VLSTRKLCIRCGRGALFGRVDRHLSSRQTAIRRLTATLSHAEQALMRAWREKRGPMNDQICSATPKLISTAGFRSCPAARRHHSQNSCPRSRGWHSIRPQTIAVCLLVNVDRLRPNRRATAATECNPFRVDSTAATTFALNDGTLRGGVNASLRTRCGCSRRRTSDSSILAFAGLPVRRRAHCKYAFRRWPRSTRGAGRSDCHDFGANGCVLRRMYADLPAAGPHAAARVRS